MATFLREYTNKLSRSRLADLYAERMPAIAVGGFPAAVHPLTLPRGEYLDLLTSTASILKLHRKAVRLLGRDSAERACTLGANPREFPRPFLHDGYELSHADDMARADVILSAHGPKFIELNVGAGFGGMVQFETHRRIWEQVAVESGQRKLLGTDPYLSLARLIARSATELGTTPSSAVFINSGEDSGRPRTQIEAQLALLCDYGISARNVDFRTDLRTIDLNGDTPLALFQYSEREALDEGWDLTAITDHVARGLVGIPSQTARLLDSKKVLALLSEEQAWMSEDDVRLVRRVVPWTRIVREGPVWWQGEKWDLHDLLTTHRNLFVLKGSAGYSAKEVTFGDDCTAVEWVALLDGAIESEYLVAQEVVDSIELTAELMSDSSGTTYEMRGRLVVNPFVIDGVPTGCRARIDASDKRVISLKGGATTACLLGDPNS